MAQRWGFPKPAEGLGGGTVVQGSTACLVRLVDLSASVHQGHGALIPPISSRIVQRCPLRRNQEGERFRVMEITRWNKIQSKLKADLRRIMTLTFPSSPSYSSRYHYLRASSDIQHFCEERGFKKRKQGLSYGRNIILSKGLFLSKLISSLGWKLIYWIQDVCPC